MNMGTALKDYRNKSGHTQQSLADLLQVERQTISKWETNKSNPTLSHLCRVCELYQISMEELFKKAIKNKKDAT